MDRHLAEVAAGVQTWKKKREARSQKPTGRHKESSCSIVVETATRRFDSCLRALSSSRSNHQSPERGLMESSSVTPQRIMEMAWGYAPPLILESAVRNGLFDALEKGPRTLEEIAAATGVSERGARAVLNALVGFGFLSVSGGTYSLTPESSTFLVRRKPGYLGGFLHHISEQLIPNWLKLAETTRSGKPPERVNSEQEGAEFFKTFVKDLFPMNYPAAKALADALAPELSTGSAQVLDLAAGSGVWGLALAQRWPGVSVTAVDWSAVTPVTREVAQQLGLADRLRVINGDILTAELGTGYRVATLGHILHSEGIDRSRRLLRRVYDALAPGGTIAIAEFIVKDDRTGPPQALIFAVNMLVNTDQGDTFSVEEMSNWLAESGFTRIRTLDVGSHSPLLLGTKPKV
jgi:SAM-dependent methyltransferase